MSPLSVYPMTEALSSEKYQDSGGYILRLKDMMQGGVARQAFVMGDASLSALRRRHIQKVLRRLTKKGSNSETMSSLCSSQDLNVIAETGRECDSCN